MKKKYPTYYDAHIHAYNLWWFRQEFPPGHPIWIKRNPDGSLVVNPQTIDGY